MTDSTELLREQRLLRELSASVTRALADDPSVHIRQQRFFKGNQPLADHAPHLRLHDSEKKPY